MLNIINDNSLNNNLLSNYQNFIYMFCGDDHDNINTLYSFNIINKKIKKLKFKNKQKEFGTFKGSLFSISSTSDSIYILNGNKYLKYIILKKTLLLSNSFMDEAIYRSTIYDGKEHIYIFGGLLNGELQESIYKWNINTGEYIKYANIDKPILECQLCYSPQENFIYILGGWMSDKDYNQTIDVFDIKQKTVKTIYRFKNKETLFS